jgi:Secretion system C-terminal sorting domain
MRDTFFCMALFCAVSWCNQANAQASCARSSTMIITIKAGCQTTPVIDAGEELLTHQIYPNPTCGDVTVSGVYQQQIRNISVYNMLGRRLLNMPIAELPHTFSMQNMPSGIYILTIGNEKYVKSVRLVKDNHP